MNGHWGEFKVSATLGEDLSHDIVDHVSQSEQLLPTLYTYSILRYLVQLERRRVAACLINLKGLGRDVDAVLGYGEVKRPVFCCIFAIVIAGSFASLPIFLA